MEDFNWKDVFFLFYLYWILDIVASYHCMQFQGKLTNQTWENGKKPSFWPDFGPFDPNLGCQIFFFFFFFFFRNLAWSVTRYHVQLSPCTISEKTNTPILRKLSDGRTDVWEWFHRVLSANVEHPTNSALLKTTILEECVNLQQPKLTVW